MRNTKRPNSELKRHISKFVTLNDQEFELVSSHFKYRTVRKKQYLLQEGQVCTSDYYVLSGALRQYHVHEGRERIAQFAFEDYWISDWYSILNQTPSQFNIDAIEDSEVLVIDKNSLDLVFERVPKFAHFFRIIFQRAFGAQQHRISYMQKSAEECYADFAERYGHYEQRVSQAQIASFIGITRESLSRIKNQTLLKQRKRYSLTKPAH